MNFYKTKRWKEKRERILRRDHYECQQCKRFGRLREATTVHHVFPIEDYPEHKMASWNLISLCRRCHEQMHMRFSDELSELGIEWIERLSRNVHDKQ